MKIAYINGAFIEESKCSISIFDRGFLYGDGVFTTILVSEGKAHHLGYHLERIHQNCHSLNIVYPNLPLSLIEELIEKNKAFKGLWRLKIIITGGSEEDLDLRERLPGNVLMTLKPSLVKLYDPVRLCLFPDPIVTPISKLKTISYLERLWVKEYARSQGYDDALVLDLKSHILESSFSNFFWYDNHNVYFPKDGEPFLKGVAVTLIEKSLSKTGFECFHSHFKLEDLPSEAHLFTCNSLSGPCPVIEIEGKSYRRDQALENELQNAFRSSD